MLANAALTTASAKNRPKIGTGLLEVSEIGCGLRPPKFEHRNGADSSSLACVLGKA